MTVLHPFGIRVTDLDMGEPSADAVHDLEILLGEHGVVVLPGQNGDDRAFTRFLRRFGDLFFTEGETPVPGFPDLNIVSNVGRTTPPRSTFHVDTSYVRCPPAYTALRAVEVPAQGGATLFTNQYHAFDTLPTDVKDRVAGRTIRHVLGGANRGHDVAAHHRILRPHPVSGRTALYLSTPARCAAISGLAPVEGEELIAFLFAHSTRDENVFRHSWSPGDIVIWDNGCVLHRADHSGVKGDRVMHRGMVAAYTARPEGGSTTGRLGRREGNPSCFHDR
jgi:taurine dioxygenase